MPRILISNDDGYLAEGIGAIAAALAEWADIAVVAPDRERSGSGHAITLDRPLRIRRLPERQGGGAGGRWYIVDGTPTDCVNLGLHVVFGDQPPDLVVTGINHGANLGNDVTYSGTVGGALEAQNYGVPSVALSQRTDGPFDFHRTAQAASDLIRDIVAHEGLMQWSGRAPLLNVNFPTGGFEGTEVTTLGERTYRDAVALRNDPRGREYYWIAGSPDWNHAEGTDVSAVQNGRISVTPLIGDLTRIDSMDVLRTVLS